MDEKLKSKSSADYEDFPGARVLGMPFKMAVENYVFVHYKYRIGKGLTLVDIGKERPKLRAAITIYKKEVRATPFNIPSIRDVAHERVARVLENGFRGTRLDRQAAMTMLKRAADAKRAPSRPEKDDGQSLIVPAVK